MGSRRAPTALAPPRSVLSRPDLPATGPLAVSIKLHPTYSNGPVVADAQVLADRIALPCTLVRSEYNRAWNEVWLVDEGRVRTGTTHFRTVTYYSKICNLRDSDCTGPGWPTLVHTLVEAHTLRVCTVQVCILYCTVAGCLGAQSGAQVHRGPDARAGTPAAGQLARRAAIHSSLI